MDFDTVEDAWDFWTEFGARSADTRTSCNVRFGVHREPTIFGRYRVCLLQLEHNHLLHTRAIFQMMPSQRHISELRYGDVGNILSYFAQNTKENPFFFYDLQLDSEERITNIFWADARMRIDNGLFGDVASFDTIYSTNKESSLFAILYNETVASFEWQFQSFLNCHSQKHPKTLFTDQDPALAEAIRIVMKVTYHGLCTFHIMLNGFRHLENLMKDGSLFLTHFQECMYAYISEEAFELAQEVMLSKYSEKWASCYIKNVHTLGMRSIQLSESCNAELKRHLKSTYVVTRYDDRVGEYALKSFSESNEAIMSFNRESEDILCSCKKIEEWGFLCGHAIRILDLSFIFKVPKKYILLRWTRDIVTHQIQ
uniref:SWIM-type domain-containing protein n=1 Tax=Kalanchoe fedtschenkoi TaxID=63787 RepID=A0A7N0VNK2_KALFE